MRYVDRDVESRRVGPDTEVGHVRAVLKCSEPPGAEKVAALVVREQEQPDGPSELSLKDHAVLARDIANPVS